MQSSHPRLNVFGTGALRTEAAATTRRLSLVPSLKSVSYTSFSGKAGGIKELELTVPWRIGGLPADRLRLLRSIFELAKLRFADQYNL